MLRTPGCARRDQHGARTRVRSRILSLALSLGRGRPGNQRAAFALRKQCFDRRRSTATAASRCWCERPLIGNFRGDRERPELGRRLPLGAGAAMQPFAEMRSLSIVCFARTLGTVARGQLWKFETTPKFCQERTTSVLHAGLPLVSRWQLLDGGVRFCRLQARRLPTGLEWNDRNTDLAFEHAGLWVIR
jgi:hypothetical protein